MTKAFLIGAGATRAQYQYAPLNADFFKLLKEHTPEGYDLFFKINNTIQNYISENLLNINVEDAMIASYQFPPSIQRSFLNSLYSAIYYLLAEPTESDEHSMNNYIHTPRVPHTIFYELINDHRLNENDFFMTLNYDLYLDREILHILDNKIDYGIPDEYLGDWRRVKLLSEPIFSVYHLYGSLNWGFYDNELRIDQGAIIPNYTRNGLNLCLIPSGEKNIKSNPILKSIWSIAEERLLKADELIIIGSSLNQKDTHLMDLLKKYVEARGGENIKIIYKEDSLETWKDGRPWPIKEGSKYDYYSRLTDWKFKAYPHGFVSPGPKNDDGAIEFIFNDSK